MYKMAVIGDRTSVYGFAALGLETYYVNGADEAEEANEAKRLIRHLENEDCAVIYITERLASLIGEELERLNEAPLPAVIPIPGVYGNTGMGMRAVNESVIKAVGSDIV